MSQHDPVYPECSYLNSTLFICCFFISRTGLSTRLKPLLVAPGSFSYYLIHSVSMYNHQFYLKMLPIITSTRVIASVKLY